MNNYLIVVDMQNDFIDGSLGTREAQSIVPFVVQKIKNHHGPVIYTMDTHDEDYLTTQEGEKLPVPHCIMGTEGWALNQNIEGLRLSSKTLAFSKPTFGSRELAEHLYEENNKHKIDSIELVGLCTDICVISNALLIKAWLPEITIMVDASCCAGVTPDSHNNSLEAMKMCQIEVVNS
jgi:nicotinamidase-related amidase